MASTYQTEADGAREAAVLGELSRIWECRIEQTDTHYPVDGGVVSDFSGRVTRLVEVKCRTEKYGTLLFSLEKAARIQMLHLRSGLPVWLAVHWMKAGELGLIDLTAMATPPVVFGGRRDRPGDGRATEMMLEIPVEAFDEIRPFNPDGEAAKKETLNALKKKFG